MLKEFGWSWFESGDYPAALRSFRRALLYRQEQKVAAETRVAKWCGARTLRFVGRTEEALRMRRRLSTDWRRARGKAGYAYEELEECLLALGKSREARGFFRVAYAELSKHPWLVVHEPKRW